jgi:hypothetical protein
VSAQLEAAWDSVLASAGARPGAIEALVHALDKRRALDEFKQRVLREAAQELRADRDDWRVERAPPSANSPSGCSRREHPGCRPRRGHQPCTATCWLRDELADGERRVQDLKQDAARDGIGWRTIERVKREAGAVAARRGNAWSWSLKTANPASERRAHLHDWMLG